MDKTKKQILLFIIIIIIGAGYAINQYIIVPEKLLIEQKAKQIQEDKQKLSLLKSKNSEAVKLTAEVAKLKQVADSIGEVTVSDIDTPQLIFDFYKSCKKYGVNGENLAFQLADSNTKVDNSTSGTTNNPSSDTTKQGTTTTSPTTNPTATTQNTDDISKTKTSTDLLKLTIELKVSGDKNKVEKYIRSLNTLTARKINVKSIKLEATLATVASATGTTTASIIPNTILVPGTTSISKSTTDQVTADIIFNQYIYTNGKEITRPSTYSFYDGNTGFSNFSDMFK